ncbi:hypothetical protein GCM10029963_25940 [Micromonospora andamanensis]
MHRQVQHLVDRAAGVGRPGWPYPIRITICGAPNRPSESRSCSRADGTSIGWDSIDTDSPASVAVNSTRCNAWPATTWSTAVLPAEPSTATSGSGSKSRPGARWMPPKPRDGSRSCGSAWGPPAVAGTPSGSGPGRTHDSRSAR